MKDFEFVNPARIIFGTEPYERVEQILKEEGVKSLMLIHTNSAVRLGIFEKLESICKRNGIRFRSNGRVEANPKIGLIREIIEECKDAETDYLIAAGGGSPIDTAKAVAMGVPYDGDVWDFYDGSALPAQVLPVGVISTIPSSGSEASTASIVSNGLVKAGYEDEKLIPRFAVLDPDYTLGLPRRLTAAGLSDILSHMMERYFTNTEHTDAMDYMIVGAAKSLILNAERIMKDPGDFGARSEVQLLATIAHNDMLGMGREQDWASHRVEHELSGQYGINHGEGMAVVMLAYVKYVAEHHPKKTAQLAEQLFDVERADMDDREMTLRLADELHKYYTMLGLRTSLTEMGIGSEHFEEMADRATNNGTSTVGHYYPLDKDKFIEVLKLAL